MRIIFFTFALVLLLVVFGGAFVLSQNPTQAPSAPSGYEYFWGDGCPHCAKVAAFLETWENKDKIVLDKKEVWNNPTNASLMAQRAKACNIPPTEMGVPLLVKPDGTCVGGDGPIIDYFKSLKF